MSFRTFVTDLTSLKYLQFWTYFGDFFQFDLYAGCLICIYGNHLFITFVLYVFIYISQSKYTMEKTSQFIDKDYLHYINDSQKDPSLNKRGKDV